MMGHRQVEQAALFYEFSLERHIPADHLLRSIDRFVELGGLRRELAPFYSSIGRPSVDPELTIRMLIVGYCFGIRTGYPLRPGPDLTTLEVAFCASQQNQPPDDRYGSIATGRGKLQVQPCPQYPVSDDRPEKGGLSLRAIIESRRFSFDQLVGDSQQFNWNS